MMSIIETRMQNEIAFPLQGEEHFFKVIESFQDEEALWVVFECKNTENLLSLN